MEINQGSWRNKHKQLGGTECLLFRPLGVSPLLLSAALQLVQAGSFKACSKKISKEGRKKVRDGGSLTYYCFVKHKCSSLLKIEILFLSFFFFK